MIKTTVSAVIHKPVSEVFVYVRNMQNQTAYNSSISSSEVVEGKPNEYKIQIDLGILNLNETYKLEEVLENKLIVASCQSNLLKFTDRYEFENTDGNCLLTITDQLELQGLFKLSEGLVKMNLKQQMASNLNALKSILES
ncbi:SRPBCC family protein [Leptospira perdikensis]|uniref:Polyketide cyclase/dehydrase and lipid transport n=1 Tax=Leptospira perdikensis TaxID=2484948 RepID=A0A4R9JF27_9LEPT|nr:SRPBCC family protein [Leptospira perdikensis]TGL39737.1 polyketide cyclase/dehydrase and lipid transport [Leptospira perdikensis]